MPKRKRYPLSQSVLFGMQSRAKLARQLGMSRKELDKLAKSADQHYWEREIEDDRGKTRHVEVPTHQLKTVHTKIAEYLRRIEPYEFVFCPVKGRSNVDNAVRHAKSREIRSLDIVEFYPSVPCRRVYWFFNTVMHCSSDVSATLAHLLTRADRLPTGSPSSDIVAHYAYYDLWADVSQLVEDAGCTLTLYMDDLVISGDAVFDKLIWEVKKRIYATGLRYHKERHYRKGRAVVTGVAIRDGSIAATHQRHLNHYNWRKEAAGCEDEDARKLIVQKLQGVGSQINRIALISSQLSSD